MTDCFKLQGKTALATGCNRGIGKAIAIGLAEAGADIIGVSASLDAQDSEVNVNGIAPGYVETDNTKALREDEERYRSILARIPQGRWGVPEDFKGPAVFLASSASDYVNGSIVLVDGGWMGR